MIRLRKEKVSDSRADKLDRKIQYIIYLLVASFTTGLLDVSPMLLNFFKSIFLG